MALIWFLMIRIFSQTQTSMEIGDSLYALYELIDLHYAGPIFGICLIANIYIFSHRFAFLHSMVCKKYRFGRFR